MSKQHTPAGPLEGREIAGLVAFVGLVIFAEIAQHPPLWASSLAGQCASAMLFVGLLIVMGRGFNRFIERMRAWGRRTMGVAAGDTLGIGVAALLAMALFTGVYWLVIYLG
ncbi:MAG: hypothetical protein M3Z04_13920 [Chloroflexota bacterium]|nr:hypothetical protein [Chloroflexota bacterium]